MACGEEEKRGDRRSAVSAGSGDPRRTGDIDELIPQKKSLMPDGQLNDLVEEQVRKLFAYLRSTQPLND